VACSRGVETLAIPFPTLLAFGLLLLAVFGLWLHRWVWIGALLAAILAGYHSGALQGLAALWIAITAALAWIYTLMRSRGADALVFRWLAGIAFFVFALAMALALLPGFTRVELVSPQVLSAGAVPYAIAVGFPKVVTGILILGVINPTLLSARGLGAVLLRAAPIFAGTVVLVTVFALAMGYTAFAPKWTRLFLLWAPINLLFTCLAEEAFFRGFVQRELASWGLAAVAIGALLFGLAHFAGGVTYVFAGVIAGLGYGWAFHRTQRIEAAMAVHFGVNAVHFLLFVYPRLA
jgi:membrane protease YdiL (CAAX protease family)